jgi:hypothetical protein
MYDLDVLHRDRPYATCEITSAVDSEFTEFWHLLHNSGQRWIDKRLSGGWIVDVPPSARVRRLLRELPGLLEQLEARGIRQFGAGADPPDLQRSAAELRVKQATQGETNHPGSIYVNPELPLERTGGYAGGSGDALSEWVAGFLRAPKREDVRKKLAASGAAETHAFILVAPWSDVPFGVMDLLIRDDAPLPVAPPALPEAIGQVWVASGWSAGVGFRWSDDGGWKRFDKLQDRPGPRFEANALPE